MTTVTATWIEKTDTFTFKSDKYKATYENIKFIGQGGVGEVYSCRNTATNQKLAIKKITKHCEIIFQSEPIIRALKHPHLMETYDIYYVEAQNRPTILFFTMPLMESDIKLLIESRREKQKYFSEKFLMRLLTQVSSVLRYIHSKSVLHRDISPDNIMIKSFKEGDEDSLMVVLSDFDTVREHEGTLMNKTNLVGKRFYAAPEMAGSTYGTPIDIWSLGVVMIELMTFSPMFHFRPFTEVILDEISQEQVLGTLAAEMRKRYSEELVSIVCSMLSYKPHLRPTSQTLDYFCTVYNTKQENTELLQQLQLMENEFAAMKQLNVIANETIQLQSLQKRLSLTLMSQIPKVCIGSITSYRFSTVYGTSRNDTIEQKFKRLSTSYSQETINECTSLHQIQQLLLDDVHDALPLSLVIMGLPEVNKLTKILRTAVSRSNVPFGQTHVALQVGKQILYWSATSLCFTPNNKLPHATLVMELPSIPKEHVEKATSCLAQVIQHYNGSLTHDTMDFHNQRFIIDCFAALNITLHFPGIIHTYMEKSIKKQEYKRKIELTEEFQLKCGREIFLEQIDAKDGVITFDSHDEFDKKARLLLVKLEEEQFGDSATKHELIFLLHSFDKAFWLMSEESDKCPFKLTI